MKTSTFGNALLGLVFATLATAKDSYIYNESITPGASVNILVRECFHNEQSKSPAIDKSKFYYMTTPANSVCQVTYNSVTGKYFCTAGTRQPEQENKRSERALSFGPMCIKYGFGPARASHFFSATEPCTQIYPDDSNIISKKYRYCARQKWTRSFTHKEALMGVCIDKADLHGAGGLVKLRINMARELETFKRFPFKNIVSHVYSAQHTIVVNSNPHVGRPIAYKLALIGDDFRLQQIEENLRPVQLEDRALAIVHSGYNKNDGFGRYSLMKYKNEKRAVAYIIPTPYLKIDVSKSAFTVRPFPKMTRKGITKTKSVLSISLDTDIKRMGMHSEPFEVDTDSYRTTNDDAVWNEDLHVTPEKIAPQAVVVADANDDDWKSNVLNPFSTAQEEIPEDGETKLEEAGEVEGIPGEPETKSDEGSGEEPSGEEPSGEAQNEEEGANEPVDDQKDILQDGEGNETPNDQSTTPIA